MVKHSTRIIYGSVLLSALALSACASSDPGKSNGSVRPAQPFATKSRTGDEKPQGLTSGKLRREQDLSSADALRREQDQSSLDALRRGETTNTARASAMKDVYFDFDQYNLDNADRKTLQATAEWLKRNPLARVELEGHCDERGASEYNLALGAKRAQAAKDYLVSLGVAENRLSTISYGEEIPVCRDEAESCWQQNRRDRFVRLVSAQGTF